MRFLIAATSALLGATPAFAAEPLADETMSGLTVPLYCSGGEPFWGLTILDAKTAKFTWDNQPTTWKIRSVGHAMQRPTTWRVMFEGKNREAMIFDEGQQSCSDTDGDQPLAYGLLLENGDSLLRGCCDPAAK